MFAEHQPLIAAHGRTPEGFVDVATFVIASQQQRFFRVGAILDDLRTQGLVNCKWLTASQKRGIAYATLTANTYAATPWQDIADTLALRTRIEIPQIGLAKGGFLLQLLSGRAGCLDRHNLHTLGLHLNAVRSAPLHTEALSKRLALYLATCAAAGTPEHLWNAWCRLIAQKYPTEFRDAEEVSYLHARWCRALH